MTSSFATSSARTAPDGSITVGTQVGVGRTLQFQVRDAIAADEDLRALLAGVDANAALLFTCTGRGIRLFGTPDHDAALVEELLGPLPVAGRVLRRRARAGRWAQLRPRLHGQPGPVRSMTAGFGPMAEAGRDLGSPEIVQRRIEQGV